MCIRDSIRDIRSDKSPVCKNVSSLHDLRTWLPIRSVAAILWVSSARFTPPIAATSLISSSPVAEYEEDDALDFLSGYFNVGADEVPCRDADDNVEERDGVDNFDDA